MTEWVLVPREPTAKMVLAAFDAITNASGEGMIRARWRCMLDAAPAAPQQAAHNAIEINNLVGKTDSQQAGPVWMRPDQLQKARHAPFLCRVSPTKDAPDLMPMFLHPPADEVQRLRDALHQISLVSQNSAGSKDECGRIARRALEGASDA